MTIDLIKKVQIKAQVRILIFNKAPLVILAKYSNYNNIFLVEKIVELSKYTNNNHIIKLKKDKLLFLGLIYSLNLVKLKIFKIYIKTN